MTTLTLFIALAITLIFQAFAFARAERVYFYLAGFGFLAIGFAMWERSAIFSIITALAGIYNFVRGL